MMTKSTFSIAFVAIAAALLITGALVRASESDDRIESSARKSYIFKTYLKDDSIKTESTDGAVTLTGSVSDATHKTLAQDTIEGLSGVKTVDNQLIIKGDTPAQHSDTWIGWKVNSALLFHRNVNASETTVNVKDGIVTLQGKASSMAQKDLTAEYARDVDNVKDVRNDMTVVTTSAIAGETMHEKIDDASITAEVKSSLRSHRSTSTAHTTVSTRDGVVTVRGIAKNDAEKRLVTKLSDDINGVAFVVNNMTIAPPVAQN
jgi:hyperosmotically inducible protein